MAKKDKRQKVTLTADARQGLVVKNTGSAYDVRLDDGLTVSCRIKGNFRIKGIRTTNPVAVGDHVMAVRATDDVWYITEIMPRHNYIIRRASNLSKESHILAANIDRALLVVTLRDPEVPLTFIDRFLATAEAYRIPAGIILNKCDMWDDSDRELGEAMKHLYDSIGYKTLIVSAATGFGLDALREETADNISLLAGNSGVGKSSLINSLIPGLGLRTGEISGLYHTGTHTTTFSEMLDLPYGGEIIDIPGVRSFGTIDFTPEDAGHFFPEIFKTARDCRYSDCRHTGEPGCAVKDAVADHLIAESRYASYLNILEEVAAGDADKYRKPF
ncbi:MAG: ribosome small subunit-dependent GTPase A [Muribaculaceae bacterium]|nr:ribosome small subunit-dependent GTPase A [Muribaculaceae bacterium]